MRKFDWTKFNKVPIVGIVRGLPAEDMIAVAKAFANAGLTTIEITLNTPGALETITLLDRELGDVLNIGAGTVCSVEELDLAVSAGATFIVTPVINPAVISKCVANKITIFPGAYTPSEIYQAWAMGAEMIKVFPATKLGVGYIRDVLAPLNKVRLMPTGGVSLENLEDFFNAGAVAVGMGSNLFPGQLVQSKDWKALENNLSKYADAVRRIIQE